MYRVGKRESLCQIFSVCAPNREKFYLLPVRTFSNGNTDRNKYICKTKDENNVFIWSELSCPIDNPIPCHVTWKEIKRIYWTGLQTDIKNRNWQLFPTLFTLRKRKTWLELVLNCMQLIYGKYALWLHTLYKMHICACMFVGVSYDILNIDLK